MAKKKLLALALTAAMLSSSMTAFASEPIDWNNNGGTASVEGSNGVVEAYLEVELPGDLAFAINPMRLDADGDTTTTTDDNTQIVAPQFMIRNHSNVDVLITTSTKAEGNTADSNLEFMDKIEASDYDGKSYELVSAASKRAIALAMELPTGAATENNGEVALKFTKIKWDESGKGASNGATLAAQYLLTGTPTEVLFLLQATGGDTFVPGSVSGFTFSGAVDPSKNYSADDVKVTTVFTMNTMTDAQAKAYTPSASGAYTGLDTTVVKVTTP